MTFGTKLRELRKSKNLNTTELAEKLEVSQAFISGLENDKELPSLDTIRKIAVLFSDTDDKEKNLMEYELRCLARKPPDSLLDSIEKHPHLYRQIEHDIAQVDETNGQPGILRLAAQSIEQEEFRIDLPNLPVIGQEAGYVLILFKAPKTKVILVSSKSKPVSNLRLQIVRQRDIIFGGVTDENGNADIGMTQLKEGDTVTLDVSLHFTINESMLRLG